MNALRDVHGWQLTRKMISRYRYQTSSVYNMHRKESWREGPRNLLQLPVLAIGIADGGHFDNHKLWV